MRLAAGVLEKQAETAMLRVREEDHFDSSFSSIQTDITI